MTKRKYGNTGWKPKTVEDLVHYQRNTGDQFAQLEVGRAGDKLQPLQHSWQIIVDCHSGIDADTKPLREWQAAQPTAEELSLKARIAITAAGEQRSEAQKQLKELKRPRDDAKESSV